MGIATPIFAQDNLATWPSYRTVTINTSATGANILTGPITQGNLGIPIVVNLSVANEPDVLTMANANSVRFSLTDGVTELPYQLVSWTQNVSAQFWVWVPSVVADSTAGAVFNMYWGKSGVASTSNGAAVFDTNTGFLAVWHMDDSAAGDTLTDATGYGHTATSVGAIAPTSTLALAPLVGAGKHFTQGATCTVAATTGCTTGTGVLGTDISLQENAASNLLNTNGPFSITAWLNPIANGGSAGRMAVFSIYDSTTTGKQYSLGFNNGASGGTQWQFIDDAVATGNGEYNATFATATPGSVTAGSWQYIAASYSNPTVPPVAGTATGILISKITTAGVMTTTTSPGGSGAFVGGTGIGTTATPYIGTNQFSTARPRYFGGDIDELMIHNVVRSAGWLMLSAQTENPAVTTAVTLGATLSNVIAPTVATSPASQSSTVGSLVNFTVVATGTTPLIYDWLHTHGGTTDTLKRDTLSALTDTLKLTSVPLADTGSFKVLVSNSAGSVVSGSATLTLTAGPAILSSPASATIILGGSIKFGILVSGTTPLTYKWMHLHGGVTDTLKKDTTSLLTDSLALTSVPQADTGSYEVFVSNSAGSATSLPGVLSIYTVPGAPTNVTVKGASGQVTVYWATPPSNGSAITSYKVTAVQDTSKHCTATTADSCVVTNLTNTTSYTFTMVAINSAGSGAATTSAAVTEINAFTAKNGFGLQMAGSTMLLRMPSLSGEVRVSILDMWGRTVWNRTVSGDIGQVTWNGNSNQGSAAPVGMYVLRLAFQKGAGNPASAIQTTFVKQ